MANLDDTMTPREMLTGRKTKRRLTKRGKRKNRNPIARTPLRGNFRWKKG